MTINERIIQAVTQVVPVCVPGFYAPDAGEQAATVYCTFNYTETPDSFGDDAPGAVRYLCQIHLYAPWTPAAGESNNTLAMRKALRRALTAAGFTAPSVTDASDEDGQHYVFECEDCDGDA